MYITRQLFLFLSMRIIQYKQFLMLAFLVFLGEMSDAQGCTDYIHPSFKSGEKLHYILHYNWGFIWLKAGEVFFETKDTLFDEKPGFVLRSHGKSMPNWDWFYHVDSKYESHTDDRLNPFYFSRIGEEGSHYYCNEYSIVPDSAVLKSKNENGIEITKTIPLQPCSFDVMSAIYYCRSIPFEEYHEGDIIPLNLILDGDCHHSQVRYVGKEQWKNPTTNKKYDCILFKPLLISGSVFAAGENMTVYVTDDEKKMPVYIVTDLKVGKAKVYLQDE